MKIAVIGAAGVRTPLIVQAMARRQERLGLDELSLMDIDGQRLELIGSVIDAAIAQAGAGRPLNFHITRTTDPRQALQSADYVITTFRVGGIESRVIDERVPLSYGVLGQETTGPGGFAMGLRSIPVILDYVQLMRQVCPQAWLINFANPAGMLAEAVWRIAQWERVVGICDAPSGMARVAAALAGAPVDEVYLDYFGLNHLGWLRSVRYAGQDLVPQFLQTFQQVGELPGLPFDGQFLATLGMIPNEYLYYYYSASQAVQNILAAGQTRGERIAVYNRQLFDDLRRLKAASDPAGMLSCYQAYLDERGRTYMADETGSSHDPSQLKAGLADQIARGLSGEGYAGVALDLIEALSGGQPRLMVLNIPNRDAIHGMGSDDVVEIPAYAGHDLLHPLAVGSVPSHPLGLMQQVKVYEQLAIQAAVQGSYALALQALVVHPLVHDYARAKAILEGYIAAHGANFPRLS
jgi:6-phospho-beta-glucosidase